MTLERTSTAACRPRPPEQSPDVLFERAQLAEDAGDIAEAERLYRVLMNCDPTDAAPPFNLGNLFRATGRKIEAEAALRAATRADPNAPIGVVSREAPIPQHHGHGTSPMSPREPQRTPPKTFAMQSSRDVLEKLRREIDRLAGPIIRQDIVDNGLNAAMTAWHLTDWVWREIQGSTRRP